MENENVSTEQDTGIKFPIKIKLSKPIVTDEGALSEIVVKREPLAKDWIGFSMTNPDPLMFVRVLANTAEIPFVFLKKVTTKDMFKIQEVVADFLE